MNDPALGKQAPFGRERGEASQFSPYPNGGETEKCPALEMPG